MQSKSLMTVLKKKINKPILIYIDAQPRDLLVAQLLKYILQKNNFSVFLVSRTTYSKILYLIRPSLYLVIKNFFKNFEANVLDSIKKSDVHVIDAEGAMSEERVEFHYTHFGIQLNRTLAIVKYAYLWNRSLSNYLQKKSIIDDQKVRVLGSSKLSLGKYLCKHRKPTKKIGFVGRFSATNDFMKRSSLFTTIDRTRNEDVYVKGAIGELEVLNIYLLQIKRIISETDLNVSIRPHPNENFDSWKLLEEMYGDRVTISSAKEDFLEWVGSIDKIITTPSTSMIEPILYNIPVICIDQITGFTTHKYYEEMLDGFLNATIRPRSEEALFQAIVDESNEMPTKDETFKKDIYRYYNVNETEGYDSFETICANILKEYQPGKFNKLSSYIYFIPYFLINAYEWLKIKMFHKNEMFYHYNYLSEEFSKKRNEISIQIQDKLNIP